MIKKFNEYLTIDNYQELRKRLTEKLLSIDGEEVVLGTDTNVEMNRMLNNGRLFKESINYLNGQPNRCHSNVADRCRRQKGFNIVTGYALSNNVWYCHSWGYNKHKACIFETTKVNYTEYYGYELNKVETDLFCDEN